MSRNIAAPGVADKKQPVKPSAAAAAPRVAAKQKTFTMRHLWRLTLWAMTAAGALLLAVLSTRSEVGSQRIAATFPSRHDTAQVAARPYDAQAETRRLAAAVNDLAAENGELKSRLAALERNMEDMTGSVSRQIAAVKAEKAPPWPADATPAPVTPATVASIVHPTVPAPAGWGAPAPSPPAAVPAAAPAEATATPAEATPAEAIPDEATTPATGATEYAVDVGSALSIEVLRARWLGIRSAHPQLFSGLTPILTLRGIPRTNRSELRLVVGPLPTAGAAAELCATLAPYRLYCQPTVFDRQHIVLR